MVQKMWNGGSDNWTTAADWGGTLPAASDDAFIGRGTPTISSNIGTVKSITIAFNTGSGGSGGLTFDHGTAAVTGAVSVDFETMLSIDAASGQGGSSFQMGSLTTRSTAIIQIGNAALTSSDTVTTSTLANSGSLTLVGNTTAGTTKQATLAVHSTAGFGTAGHLSGTVSLSGDSAIVFDNGGISTIDAGASFTLNGPQARVAVAADASRNTALGDNLTSILGRLSLEGSSIDLDTDLVVGSSSAGGTLAVDDVGGTGGSYLELGTLALNQSTLQVGNSALSASTTLGDLGELSADSGTTITVLGGAHGGPLATLDIGSQAPTGHGLEAGFGTAGHLTGQVTMVGNSLIVFQTGQITNIDGSLTLVGPDARIALASDTTSNSALTGLTQVDGSLTLENGTKLETSGALSAQTLKIDDGDTASGSRLSVQGGLRVAALVIGNGDLRSSTVVTASSLSAISGSTVSLSITGDPTRGTAKRASLVVGSAAGFGTNSVFDAKVTLSGAASLLFASGGFTNIASGAYAQLTGSDAHVAIKSDAGSNSAFSHLAKNSGTLALNEGASIVTQSTDFQNLSRIDVDQGFPFSAGGSVLSIGGKLTNSGDVNVGNFGIIEASTLNATALENIGGTISIVGSTYYGAGAQSVVSIAGGGSSTGSIDISNDALFKVGSSFLDSGTLSLSGSTVEIGGGIFDAAGSISGDGRFLLDAGATLRVRSTAGDLRGDIVQFNGSASSLLIEDVFAGVATGFGGTDVIGVGGLLATDLSYMGTTLTVTSGSTFRDLKVIGTFTGLAGKNDGTGGTTITGLAGAYALTSGADIVLLVRDANTIAATAATLNATDKLTGGSGTDTLALSGGGTFALGGLAAFTGFEDVTAAAGASYSVTIGDANVAAGATFTMDGSGLAATNKLTFNGAAETDGRFVVRGGAGADNITTGAGADTINGGAGVDRMAGGAGNDVYYVDNSSDKVIEADGGGTDTVYATASFSLAGQFAERLTLTGSAAINGTGNGLANQITGNKAANILDGGAGIDKMTGGAGKDTYYVDDVADKVIEANKGGTDTVHATVSFKLGQYVENLTLDGTTALDGSGNGLANKLIGNSAANVLNGGGGNDTLTGGGGTDTFSYHADWAKDHITDFTAGAASGHDIVQIDRTLFANYADLMAHTIDSHGSAVISLDASNTITLDHVKTASLVSADFKFV